DRNRSHWSTSKTPSYTKSVSWQHHRFIDDVIELVISYLSIADINLNRWSLLILNIALQK
ncbi:hypothetical protein ACV17A_24590, partial [Escherichia coli]